MQLKLICVINLAVIVHQVWSLTIDDVERAHINCIQKLGVKPEEEKSFGSLTTKREKCVLACFYKELKVIGPNNVIDKPSTMEVMKVFVDEINHDRAEEIIDDCIGQVTDQIKDECELAAQHKTCFDSAAQAEGLFSEPDVGDEDDDEGLNSNT